MSLGDVTLQGSQVYKVSSVGDRRVVRQVEANLSNSVKWKTLEISHEPATASKPGRHLFKITGELYLDGNGSSPETAITSIHGVITLPKALEVADMGNSSVYDELWCDFADLIGKIDTSVIKASDELALIGKNSLL
jgi:hypothetical protein